MWFRATDSTSDHSLFINSDQVISVYQYMDNNYTTIITTGSNGDRPFMIGVKEDVDHIMLKIEGR